MQLHIKNPKFHFMYLGNQKISCIFKMYWVCLFCFPQNAIYFLTFSFPFQLIRNIIHQ